MDADFGQLRFPVISSGSINISIRHGSEHQHGAIGLSFAAAGFRAL
jgi:hypothetical protein